MSKSLCFRTWPRHVNSYLSAALADPHSRGVELDRQAYHSDSIVLTENEVRLLIAAAKTSREILAC